MLTQSIYYGIIILRVELLGGIKMGRLLKKGSSRTYEFLKLEDAKAAAKQYAKEDSMDYAVIQPPTARGGYEVIPDDFREEGEGLETIPAIVWHTSENK